MRKQPVTLEALNKKIDKVDFKLETKIDVLDRDIKKDHIDRDKIFVDMEQRLREFKSETRSTLELIEFRFNELMGFLKEHMMMRGEIEQQIETKFIKYTSDQFEFQDQIGKRCENTEHETLAIEYRVKLIEKRVGI